MKHHPPEVQARLRGIPIGDVAVSSIVLAELWHGVCKSKNRKRNQEALSDFLSYCSVLDWPREAAPVYGEIRSSLEAHGQSIGGNDLLIASHTIHVNAVLVTNNEREFRRVQGLQLENWVSI
jgi:tRNA(fMet)-specific endonuclease VapC